MHPVEKAQFSLGFFISSWYNKENTKEDVITKAFKQYLSFAALRRHT